MMLCLFPFDFFIKRSNKYSVGIEKGVGNEKLREIW